MSEYWNATNAARDALISGLNEDMKIQTLGELWRHYCGLRTIAEGQSPPPAPHDPDANVTITPDLGEIDYYSDVVAGAPVFTLGDSNDTITFS